MMQRIDSWQPSHRRIALNWISGKSFRLVIRGIRRRERRGHTCPAQPGWGRVRWFALTTSVLLAAVLLLAGCSSPTVRQQRLVSKPNMLFSDSSVFTYNSARLLPQLEPGSATSGGAQNAGCTACR